MTAEHLETARAGRSVTSRVLGVLDAFSDRRPSLTLSEISRRSGIPLATAHRLVGELVSWGALERDAAGRYHVGLRLWEVGALAPRGPGLRDTALPCLHDLAAATHHEVRFAVLDGCDVVSVERIPGRDGAGERGRPGTRLPAHATGVGLALLAFAPATVQRWYLSQPLGTVDGRVLRGTLAGVRQRGYAIGEGSVAAPVRDGTDEAVAAVSVVVPASVAEPGALVPAVLAAARGIARRVAAERDGG
jgi:DNA-binding IclR family transcriptional regulator